MLKSIQYEFKTSATDVLSVSYQNRSVSTKVWFPKVTFLYYYAIFLFGEETVFSIQHISLW